MAFDSKGFDRSVPLPPELNISHIREAIEHVEGRAAELIDIYFEQANVFSGIVGIIGVQALHALSPYKKHKHPDVAQQRFPDLSLRGKLGPPPEHALESKGSTRPWALQSHYNHPGWYIVWRYAIDQTQRLKPGRMVAIWRVDIPFLRQEGLEVRRQQGRRRSWWTYPHLRRKESGKAVQRFYCLPESESRHKPRRPCPRER